MPLLLNALFLPLLFLHRETFPLDLDNVYSTVHGESHHDGFDAPVNQGDSIKDDTAKNSDPLTKFNGSVATNDDHYEANRKFPLSMDKDEFYRRMRRGRKWRQKGNKRGKSQPNQWATPKTEDGNQGNANLGLSEGTAGKKPDFETNYMGDWKVHSENSGVSAMHIQLLPNNKVVMFDATNIGPSNITLPPPHPANCRSVPKNASEVDCWAHAVEYDTDTAKVRPLKVLTDTWCSSGALSADGSLLNTGGFEDGGKGVRIMPACDTCDWKENAGALSGIRWYSTQHMLEDGSFVVVGGRGMFNYEFVPNSLNFPIKQVDLPFLKETTDLLENNLYPFVYLAPDGNLFILANNRSILLQPATGKIVWEFPVFPGGSRNYPASAMSALLPLKLGVNPTDPVEAEVLVCGGAKPEAADLAGKGTFLPALQDCGRMTITKPEAKWDTESMPSPRVMGDMLLLPTGDVLILNGATTGVSGWDLADSPNLIPLLYGPDKKVGQRFKPLNPTQIPRMYHSSSALLPDGTVLVAGSNTNPFYNFTKDIKFPTELRVEKFWPPYLDPSLDNHRPRILSISEKNLSYGQQFELQIAIDDAGVTSSDVMVTMLAPPFTTHGFSQNQRLLVLGVAEASNGHVRAVAPPSAKVSPPGYYLLFVVHRGVPSTGLWTQTHA